MNESVKKSGKRAISPINGQELPPGRGRPKGSKNKFTTLKEEFLKAFYDSDGIGGAEGIKKLLKNNNRNKLAFLNMIAKMLPSNIDIDHSGQIDGKLTIEVVETK